MSSLAIRLKCVQRVNWRRVGHDGQANLFYALDSIARMRQTNYRKYINTPLSLPLFLSAVGARHQIGAVQRACAAAALAEHLCLLWQSTHISEVGAALVASLRPAHAALSG